jgi:hypothetical protein
MYIEAKAIDYGNNEFKTTLPPTDLKGEHSFVSNQFHQFYHEHGYQLMQPTNLLPKNDESVLFTGATITPLKKYLIDGIPTPGLCLVQKCLRTKRLELTTDISHIPDWTHYFTMCGILSAPDRKEATSKEAHDLLVNRLHINPNNLLVEASSEDNDLSNYWTTQGINVIQDTQPQQYYRWQYGLSDIYGRGINLLLRSDDNSPYRDLGNFISIENNDNTVLGYEFGFGLESMLATLHGFKKPMEASLVSAVIPYKEGQQEKFIDTMMAAVVIYRCGVEPGRGKEKYVLKKLVNGLSFLRRKMAIDYDQIIDWSNKFEAVEFGSNTISDKLITDIQGYEEKLAKFLDYARNQVHAHKLKNDMGEKLITKLKNQGEMYGILPIEIDEVVKIVLS